MGASLGAAHRSLRPDAPSIDGLPKTARILLLAHLGTHAHLLHDPVALLTADDVLDVSADVLVSRDDEKVRGLFADGLVLLDGQLHRLRALFISALA